MTLDGFEQPDLIRWLMDRTDPKTMTIQISENKKIAITPWKISIVLGTPFGGEPLQYPDKKCMAAAFAQLANELGVPPSSNISVPMLKSKLEHRKDDPTAVRFFIMILTNKLLLPSTSFYITKKDAWLGMDLSRVARIDWSKAVFDLLRDSLLLYIDNLDVIKLGLTIDRLHTPRIQLYTKDLVEAISQGDRVKDEEDKIVFGQLNETAQRAGTYTEKQPTFHGEPAAMPSNQEDVPKLADTAPQSRTPPSTAVMECLVNTTVIPDSTALINIENVTRNDTKDNYKPDALVEQLHFALGNIEMFLPVIHDDHWSLYIINHNQKSFDILDSKRYDMIGGTETQHHFPMAQKILKRLSDGFQVFMGGKFPKFGNYRKCYIKCPKMAMGSNGFLCHEIHGEIQW
ncbi:uncharacterized protein LOC127774153 [Oryza glaberrima]|uniref:uncharacterized protein LOC127774153 n=1 Tax=Oryza glaberrima TaxID=4538 RepID=UPI00224BEA43|nr:uncharacterized protein LOC127774153 [Oryza glaberrima]